MKKIICIFILILSSSVFALKSNVGMNTDKSISATIKTLKDFGQAQYCIQATIDEGYIATELTERANDAFTRISSGLHFGIKVLNTDTVTTGKNLIKCMIIGKATDYQ